MYNLFTNIASSVTQGINDLYVPGTDLEEEITHLSIRTVTIAGISLVILTIIAALLKDHAPKLKVPLFFMMAFAMAGSFILLAGATVYLNVKSDSGGPVHWHADIEYWACGNELELRNPTGALSNKIGTAVLHEHDDQRIHLEGVVVDGIKDASLGKFMYVIGGAITDTAIVLPLNESGHEDGNFEDHQDADGPSDTNQAAIADYIIQEGNEQFFRAEDGQTCSDQEADVQVFVYNFNADDKTYEQKKLDKPQDYIIHEDPNVPPGDCIIFEFDSPKPYTDKLCEQYGVRDLDKCEDFGVGEEEKAICENKDVTDYETLQTTFDEAQESETQQDENIQPVVSEEDIEYIEEVIPYIEPSEAQEAAQ